MRALELLREINDHRRHGRFLPAAAGLFELRVLDEERSESMREYWAWVDARETGADVSRDGARAPGWRPRPSRATWPDLPRPVDYD